MTRVIAIGPWLDRSVRFWVAVLYVVVGCLVVGWGVLAVSVSRTSAHQAQETAIRVATSRSGMKAQYERCYASIEPLSKFNEKIRGDLRHVRVTYATDAALVESTARTLAATPPDDPLLAARRKSLGEWLNLRSEAALAMAQMSSFGPFPVPTEAECARESGVPAGQRHS